MFVGLILFTTVILYHTIARKMISHILMLTLQKEQIDLLNVDARLAFLVTMLTLFEYTECLVEEK